MNSRRISMLVWLAIVSCAFLILASGVWQQDQRRRAVEKANREALAEAIDFYQRLLAEVERRTLATDAVLGSMPRTESIEDVLRRVAEMAEPLGMGRHDIRVVATAIASARAPLSRQEERPFAEWYCRAGRQALLRAPYVIRTTDGRTVYVPAIHEHELLILFRRDQEARAAERDTLHGERPWERPVTGN